MEKAVWVKLDRCVDTSQTCWIENECVGIDQDIRVTRGPITLKRGVARLLLYVENRSLYETMNVKKGMFVGQAILMDIMESKSL
jgi:hypothetical protein